MGDGKGRANAEQHEYQAVELGFQAGKPRFHATKPLVVCACSPSSRPMLLYISAGSIWVVSVVMTMRSLAIALLF